ncbi:Sterol desaturase/sphingolipid hydroxylase, fatty acid hydroxylase superfamily [Noviherbaspirillum humi]|uniref:Sterol desaturase/sphingolipid hydroxylase, fatty acid hydroxylase superfamily n=1 Tax=Noviherbaspirillum humi TaxID=1688639 RepID=A0A239M105_9BURK|nr:sterol desaturase family protein [Noviherbaspirillum humi]SNT35798.1 Sterol desaturase/sphingolipid hydroxylase, fatty acid hydroxylase superfamily [Noviherbaspirillum humi]
MWAWVSCAFIAFFFLERLVPGWKLPAVRTWPIRVFAINLAQLGVMLVAGLLWERWHPEYAVFSLSGRIPDWAGGLIAYFIGTFVFYWWHRARHESDFLWKHLHQIHHSPQRLEVITAFYKHPIEMAVNALIGGVLVYMLLGLSAAGGGFFALYSALGTFFYHASVRTPHWVGYVFQRPEMHRTHHQYERHRNNYGDIAWWDMLFGTYENPNDFTATCGFKPEDEERLLEMLRFVDVHKRKRRLGILVPSHSRPAHASPPCGQSSRKP